MKYKRQSLTLLVLIALTLPLMADCRPAQASAGILREMNTPKTIIAVETGTIAENDIKLLLPQASYIYINTPSDGYITVQTGKADAFAGDRAIFDCAIREGLTGLKALDETIGENGKVAVGISPVSQIPDLENMINKFLAEMETQGVLNEMYQRWVIDGDYTMPEIAAPENPSYTIKIGTTGLLEPYTFYSGTDLTGYEMEMMRRFALWANVRFDVLTYDWGGIIPACAAGKVDCIMSNLFDTDERDDSIIFSNPYIRVTTALIVPDTTQQVPSTSAQGEPEGKTYRALSDFNGAVVGSQTGTVFDRILSGQMSGLSFQYYDDLSSAALALQNRMIDAIGMDEPVAKLITAQISGLTIFSEAVETDQYGFALKKDSPLTGRISGFIREFEADGTLDVLKAKWFGADEAAKTIQIEPYDESSGVLRYAHDSTLAPMCYVGNGGASLGYEVELAHLFAKKLGMKLEITQTNFASLLNMVTSGKADIVSGAMSITEERRQSVDFPDTHYIGGIVLVIRGSDAAPVRASLPEFASALELGAAGANLGVRTGSIQDAYTKEYIPNANILYFDNISDMIVALNSCKIDGFMTTALRVPFILRDNANLAAFELQGPSDNLAIMVARTDFGAELLPKINAFIASSRESGLFRQVYDAWFRAQEEGYPEIIPPKDLPNTNGTIRYAAQAGNEPISLMRGMDMVGFELDILTRFCKGYGYGLEVTELNISGMLAGIASGKYDMAGGGLVITEERRQSADFTDSYYSQGQWIIVRGMPAASAITAAPDAEPPHPLAAFWQGLKSSVEKNFIREGRWRLIISGIGVTLTISILSALFGTLFGFGLCMLRLRGRKAVSGMIKAFVGLIQGVPLVVLLMVLYYVVFGSININAIFVAVIGLSVNFGVYVSEMMRTGIEAVDRGQIEAALALGYSRIRTFWKITFPQAARHFLPVYKGEFISMVKMTSIVGYIAIMDLTKASDIIRSRTYEAFFPLIVTAAIYFLMAWSLTSLLNLVEIRIDPKRRSRKLKGVVES